MTRLRALLADETGSAMVAGFVVMLALTGGAIIWLTRDVDRAIGAASQADAVAFQAARAGAQAIDAASLRAGNPTIDTSSAQQRAVDAAARLFAANGSVGRVRSVDVARDRVTVVVEITEAGRTVAGQGTARIAVGVTGDGT